MSFSNNPPEQHSNGPREATSTSDTSQAHKIHISLSENDSTQNTAEKADTIKLRISHDANETTVPPSDVENTHSDDNASISEENAPGSSISSKAPSSSNLNSSTTATPENNASGLDTTTSHITKKRKHHSRNNSAESFVSTNSSGSYRSISSSNPSKKRIPSRVAYLLSKNANENWNMDPDTFASYLHKIPTWFHLHLTSKAHLRLYIKRSSLPVELRPFIYQFLCHLRCMIDEDMKQHQEKLYEKLASQTEFSAIEKRIRKDLKRTFPQFELFKTDEGQMELFRMLKSYGVMDKVVGYTQGMAFICGFLLYMFHCGFIDDNVDQSEEAFHQDTNTIAENGQTEVPQLLIEEPSPGESSNLVDDSASASKKPQLSIETDDSKSVLSTEPEVFSSRKDLECTAFWVFTSLLNNSKWNAKMLFVPQLPKLFELLYCIERTIEKKAPRAHEWIQQQEIKSEVYAAQFVMTICTNHFQSEVVERIWDLFFLDGWIWVVRLVSSIMIQNEAAILRLNDVADFVPLIYANCSKYTPEEVVELTEKVGLTEEEYEGFLAEYEKSLSSNEREKKKKSRELLRHFVEKNRHLIPQERLEESEEQVSDLVKSKRKKSTSSSSPSSPGIVKAPRRKRSNFEELRNFFFPRSTTDTQS